MGGGTEWACALAEMEHTLSMARDVFTPTNYHEAVTCDDAVFWIKAMDEEMGAHAANSTWELTDLPPGRRAISCKWVYKVKVARDGTVERYKARLVCRGFEQRKGVDYEETFAPVARGESIRLLIATAAAKGYVRTPSGGHWHALLLRQ